MKVDPKPCASCPYRKDVPSGLWEEAEYDKLPEYDDNANVQMAAFMCHQPAKHAEALCRGWLSVHADSVAVRLLMVFGKITPDEVYAEPLVPLFKSGAAAAKHGKKQINRPSAKAKEMARKIETKKERANQRA